MNALTASIQHVEPSEILWAIPLAPLAAAAVNGLFGERLVATRGARVAHAIAVGACLVALAALASVLYGFAGLPPDRRFFYEHLWSFARVGALSASVDLGADPLGASLSLVVLTLTTVAHLDLVARRASPRAHACVSLLAAGLTLAVLGDGFVPLSLGLATSTLATACLAAPSRARSILAAGHLADAAVIGGAAVLFWALGGGFGIDVGNEPTFTRHNPTPARTQTQDLDLDETLGPLVLPVAFAGSGPSPASSMKVPGSLRDAGAKGKISLAGLAGARLFLRGSATPAATAPVIGLESYAGRLDIEVERYGLPRATLHAVDVPANGEIVIVPMGPSLSFREIYDQLALVDVSKKHFVRDLLDPSAPNHRRLFGVSIVGVAAVLFALAAALRGALFPFLAVGAAELEADARTRALVVALSPVPAVYLVTRLSPIFALSNGASGVLLALGAGSAAALAIVAASKAEPFAAVRGAVAAQTALALAGAGAGAWSAAMVHAVTVSLAAMALVLTHDLPGARDKNSPSARASLAATLALAGAPIPVVGVAWSREAALQRIFAVEIPFHLGHVAWLASVVAVGLVAHALVRVHFASFPADDDGELAPDMRTALLVLPLAAALVPVVMIVSQRMAGLGPDRPLSESWFGVDVSRILGVDRASHVVEVGRAVELAIAAVTLAVSVLAGRAAYKKPDTLFEPGVESVARTPAAVLGGFVEGIGALGRFLDFALDLPLEIAGKLTGRRRR